MRVHSSCGASCVCVQLEPVLCVCIDVQLCTYLSLLVFRRLNNTTLLLITWLLTVLLLLINVRVLQHSHFWGQCKCPDQTSVLLCQSQFCTLLRTIVWLKTAALLPMYMWFHMLYSHTIVMHSYYHIVSEVTHFQHMKTMCVDTCK